MISERQQRPRTRRRHRGPAPQDTPARNQTRPERGNEGDRYLAKPRILTHASRGWHITAAASQDN